MNKIIQCPSCNTKFALNANQLVGIESPKFHCSRCNTLFSLDTETNQAIKEEPPLLESALEKDDLTDTPFVTSMSSETPPSSDIEYADSRDEDNTADSTSQDSEDKETYDAFYENEDKSSELRAGDTHQNTDSYFSTDENEEELEEDSEFEESLSEDEEDESSLPQITDKVSPTTTIKRDEINLDTNELPWKKGTKTSEIPTQTEIQLSYEKAEDPADDIRIDWPIASDSTDYVVDLSSLHEKKRQEEDQTPYFGFRKDVTTAAKPFATPNKKDSETQTRPEVKSLLASLIEDDDSTAPPTPIKHKQDDNLRFQETVSISREDIGQRHKEQLEPNFVHSIQNKTREQPESSFTLGTNAADNIRGIPELKNENENLVSSYEMNDNFVLDGQEPFSEKISAEALTSNFEIVAHPNDLDKSSKNKANSYISLEATNKENRSIKDTTVLKRGDLSTTLDDISENHYPEMDFTPTSDILPAYKNKVSRISEKKSTHYSLGLKSGAYFAVAWSVPILLLAFMYFVTSTIDADKSSFGRVLIQKIGLNEVIKDILPPNDIAISKLQSKELRLSSGERIIIASGNVLNLSNRNYSDVKIEARVFDKNQILLSKETACVPNLVTSTFFKESSYAAIKALQNSSKPELDAIMQKTITPFIIALDVSNLITGEEPKYYGVRIYSVSKKT